MFSLATMLSTFGMIFVAELPDKTALAALILASKYRARSVVLGAWLAFLVRWWLLSPTGCWASCRRTLFVSHRASAF